MGNDTKKRLATAAAFLVLATAGSRVLGLVREIVMVTYLGLGPDMGAFTVANKVPSLVRTLLADTALSAAFIPVFSGLLEKERRREAWQVAYTVTVSATVILGVVTALGMVFAPPGGQGWSPRGSATIPQIVDLDRPSHADHVPHRGDHGDRRHLHGHPQLVRPLHACRRWLRSSGT